MKTNVCVLIADGTEEMEAVIVVDVLRRAGISVFLAGVGGDRLVTTRAACGLRPMASGTPPKPPVSTRHYSRRRGRHPNPVAG